MLHANTLSIIKEIEFLVKDLLHFSDAISPYFVSGIGKNNSPFYQLFSNDQASEGEFSIKEISFREYFNSLVKTHSWLSEDQKKRVEQYKVLENYLAGHLQEIKIVKIGNIHWDVHIVGRTREDEYVILSTKELSLPHYLVFDN
ncbi:MAG: nuclease A inhibitor family protein [Cytophagaceae bacterium]|nr:nuclease A inhibitor family protein [Cytophagaceae bacterium]